MADQTITSPTFTAVTTPGVACKMQVQNGPVFVTFTPAGTDTRGLLVYPGTILPIGATDAMRARRGDGAAPTLVFEVFG